MFFHVRANGEVYTTDFSLQDNDSDTNLPTRTVVLNCTAYETAQECFNYFSQSNVGVAAVS